MIIRNLLRDLFIVGQTSPPSGGAVGFDGFRKLTAVRNTEVSDEINIDFTLRNADESVANTADDLKIFFHAGLYGPLFTSPFRELPDATAFIITGGIGGVPSSQDLFFLSVSGTFPLTVTDVVGASGSTVSLIVTPANAPNDPSDDVANHLVMPMLINATFD